MPDSVPAVTVVTATVHGASRADVGPAPHRISVAGEFDEGTCTLLDRAIDQLVSANPGDLTVDVADVSFLGAAALNCLATWQGRQAERGDLLVVANPTMWHRRVFDAGRLPHLLTP